MPNLHDYLAWRGDVSMHALPPGEADDLLFAQLSYISFGNLVPSPQVFPECVSLGAAAERLLEEDPDGKSIHQTFYMWKENKKLLQEVIRARRFRDIRLCAYVDQLSGDTQFAALCMRLSDQVTVIGFRGTDDSLAGWKEDCLLALDEPVPAQLRAAKYLKTAAENLPGRLILTGHSKGGNLAVYAASSVPESAQKRITRIVNCDGPGFSRQVIKSEGYQRIRPKLHVFLPESSVVGRLLEHENSFSLVRSTASGILQHDAFSWQIMGPKLIRAEALSPYSEYIHAVLRAWLDTLSSEQRREFTEGLFEMLSALEVKTLDEVNASLIPRLPAVIRKMHSVDKEVKEQLLKSLLDLGATALRALRRGAPEKALSEPGQGENA